MTEEAFRAFYDRTARSVWAYLARLTGDPAHGRRPAAGRLLSVPARRRHARERSPSAQHVCSRLRRTSRATRIAGVACMPFFVGAEPVDIAVAAKTWRAAFSERPTSGRALEAHEAARARDAVAGVRRRFLASGNCRRARREDGAASSCCCSARAAAWPACWAANRRKEARDAAHRVRPRRRRADDGVRRAAGRSARRRNFARTRRRARCARISPLVAQAIDEDATRRPCRRTAELRHRLVARAAARAPGSRQAGRSADYRRAGGVARRGRRRGRRGVRRDHRVVPARAASRLGRASQAWPSQRPSARRCPRCPSTALHRSPTTATGLIIVGIGAALAMAVVVWALREE